MLGLWIFYDGNITSLFVGGLNSFVVSVKCKVFVGSIVYNVDLLQVPTLGVGGLGGAVQLVPALGIPGVQLAQLQQSQPQTAQPLIGKNTCLDAYL